MDTYTDRVSEFGSVSSFSCDIKMGKLCTAGMLYELAYNDYIIIIQCIKWFLCLKTPEASFIDWLVQQNYEENTLLTGDWHLFIFSCIQISV